MQGGCKSETGGVESEIRKLGLGETNWVGF